MPELESEKTGGITTLGVLGVVFGGIWLVTAVWALLQPASIQLMIKRYRAPELLAGLGEAAAYLDATANLVLAALLFAVGVGLLRQRQWGAAWGIRWAVARIVWSVVAALLAFVGPFAARPDPEKLAYGYAEFMRERFVTIATTEIIAGLVLSSLLAVIFLCLLSRRSFKDNLS